MKKIPFLFKIIFIAALILRVALLFRSNNLFNARPFIEDAYYSLSVARSVGHGTGFTIDGIHLTNGVQPLIILLYAPLFTFFSDAVALRLCLIICIIIELCLAYLCFLLVKKSSRSNHTNDNAHTAGYTAVTIFLWSYSSSVYTLNGLETAFSAMFVLLSLLMYQRWFIDTQYQIKLSKLFFFGIMLGVMVLARIDTAFFVLILLIHYLISIRKTSRFSFHFRNVLLIGLTSVLISSPWSMYNFKQFGSFIPTSGLSQSIHVPLLENATAFVQVLLNNALVIGYIPYTPKLTSIHAVITILIIFFALIVITIKSMRKSINAIWKNVNAHWSFRSFKILLSYIVLLSSYYIFFFGAPHFLQRYLFIFHATVVCGISIFLVELWSVLSANFQSIHRFATTSLFFFLVCVFMIPYSWNYTSGIAPQNDFYQVSKWISNHTKPSEKIGMGQSGTAGFFNTNVTNLDGKVNFEVMTAHREKRYCEYVKVKQFDYLIDWNKFFNDLSYCNILSEYKCVDSVGRFYIYKRIICPNISPS